METESSPVPVDLPTPDRPLGPVGLGLRIGPPTPDGSGHGFWFALLAPSGLDGPPGVLQGGLASGLAIDVARAVDPQGGRLSALRARLEAPTLLDVPFAAYLRPAEQVGSYEVETWQRGRRLVRATVELAGPTELGALSDLVTLAEGPAPEPRPQTRYPSCFVCSATADHPLALRTSPAYRSSDEVAVAWTPDPRLADPEMGGNVASLVVNAALDCPSAWATFAHAEAEGNHVVLLGALHLRVAQDVEVSEPVRITGRMDGADGRKLLARSAIIDSEGTPLALFDAIHIGVRELPDTDVTSDAR